MESISLALGALGTLARTRGVKVGNIEWNGRQTAIALIEDARFGKDEQGNSTLSDVCEGILVKERT